MKTSNMIKILVIIIIILSIGLLATTIKLKTMDKSIVNHDTPIVVNKSSGDIVDKLEDKSVDGDPEESQDEPVVETPIEKIEDSNSIDNEEDKDSNVDDKPSKEDKPSKQEKPKDEKSNNSNKPNKDKPNKEEKKDNKDNKKDNINNNNKNNNNKNNNKNNKDKSKEEKAIVSPKYISKDEATKIGLNKVGTGAKLIKIKSDFNDNPPKYDLEIILGNYEYEIEIHAITGAVIDFEKDEK